MKSELNLADSVSDLQAEVQELFHKIMPGVVERLPGLSELLDFVEEKNIPKCVATSSFRHHAKQVLEECDLASRFDFVLTSEDVTNGKPNPEVYYLAASRHRIDPKEMLVLEDSVQGTKAGVASGSLTVAVPGRHSVDCDYGHVDHVAVSLKDNLIYDLLNQ